MVEKEQGVLWRSICTASFATWKR